MSEQNRRYAISQRYRSVEQVIRDSIDRSFHKEASSATRYAFRDSRVVEGAVVRVDLNGYSKWAMKREIQERVDLLNAFFSTLVPKLEAAGGIYFRDEGDCIIALFSPYFTGNDFSWSAVLGFAKTAVAQSYGWGEDFRAKAVIASGDDIAIFQKFHEVSTPDWSAEGQAFVSAARIEAAIESKPHFYMLKSEYDRWYRSTAPMASSGAPYRWLVDETGSVRVSGMAESNNGWVEVVRYEHLPEERIQP